MTNEEIKEEANESQDPVADESQLDEPESQWTSPSRTNPRRTSPSWITAQRAPRET